MRRSERLIRLTKWLVERPMSSLSLSDLADRLLAAKSSLSEDVAAIRGVLEQDGEGTIETIVGAGGGVRFQAHLPEAVRRQFASRITEQLADASRILPGGFLYMSDLLGHPDVLDTAGQMFAATYASRAPNVVVTVETKGIPLAAAAARYLHVPLAIVRREHRVTDGTAISLHYVSGSERRIQTMAISKRVLPKNAKALIVDDFMRAGATIKAVNSLLHEVGAEVLGTAVFMITAEPRQKLVEHPFALFSVGALEEGRPVQLTPVFEDHPLFLRAVTKPESHTERLRGDESDEDHFDE